MLSTNLTDKKNTINAYHRHINLSHLSQPGKRAAMQIFSTWSILEDFHHSAGSSVAAPEVYGSSMALMSYLTSLHRTSMYILDSLFRHLSHFQEP